MGYKLIIIITICVLIISGIFIYKYIDKEDKEYYPKLNTRIGQYQGPVQEGYDEQKFRETGIYVRVGEKDES